jgi:hypothetical protein
MEYMQEMVGCFREFISKRENTLHKIEAHPNANTLKMHKDKFLIWLKILIDL